MFCKSKILIFIFAENNCSIYAHTMLIKTPLLHQSFGPCVFLSLSPSLSFSGWSPGVQRLSEFTFLPGLLRPSRSVPSPHREGAWGLREQSKPCAGALLAFCANQGISASFSLLYFLIGWLQTTRFQSIKGPQEGMRRYLTCVSFSSYDLNFLWWFSGLNDFLRKVHSRVSGIKWVFGSLQLILLYSRYHIRWIGDTASVVHKYSSIVWNITKIKGISRCYLVINFEATVVFHKHLELFTLPPPCSVFMLLLLMLFLFSHQGNSRALTGTETWACTSGRPVRCVTWAGCFLVHPCHRTEARISSSSALRKFPPLLSFVPGLANFCR